MQTLLHTSIIYVALHIYEALYMLSESCTAPSEGYLAACGECFGTSAEECLHLKQKLFLINIQHCSTRSLLHDITFLL